MEKSITSPFFPPFYKDNELIGFQGIARDITESKKMEIRLRESEEYYRTLVETSPDAIVIVDGGGRITFTSAKAYDIFDIPAQTPIIGTSILDFVDPGDIPRVQERMVEILSGRSLPQINEYRLLKHDRQTFWGEVSSAPLRDAAGRNIGLLLVCRDVSERKRIEAALQKSEEKYRLIADNTAETITVLDLNLKFTYVSPSIIKLRGYTVEEARSLTLQQTLTPDSFAKIKGVFSEEIALEASGNANPKRSRSLELQEYRKDGSIVWVENSMSYLRDPQGKAIGFLVVAKDINERKQQIQYTIANAVVTAETFFSLFETVRKELSALFDTTNFLVALYDKANGMLSAPFEKDEKDAIPQWPAEKSLTGLVIKQKRSLLLRGEEIQQLDEAGSTEQIGSNAEAWLGVPLLINEKVLGAIVVQSYDNVNAYDQSNVNILEIVASQLSVYIERKEAEAELLREKAFLEKLVESAPEGIAITDCPGRVLRVNSEFVKMFGYEVDEAVGKKIDDLIVPPEYLEEAGTITQSVGAGKSNALETVRKRKDGTLFNVSIIGAPIHIAEQQVAVYAIYRDISERKRAEEELRISAEKWQSTFNSITDIVSVISPGSHVPGDQQSRLRLPGAGAQGHHR